MGQRVKDLEPGDIIDLEGDTYAEDSDYPDQFHYEYARVISVEDEGRAIVVNLEHQGGELVIGFPHDHIVKRIGNKGMERR